MKTLPLVFFLLFIFTPHSYCNEPSPPAIQINFEIPADWKMVDNTTYTLQNFSKTSRYWKKVLSSGRQPWRFGPANVAGACLWDFGIQDGTDIYEFADRLTTIDDGKIYSLKTSQQTFVVYIKTEKQIPIAYKLEIKK